MKKQISISEKLISALKKKGAVEQLNKQEHITLIESMNLNLEEVRREYKIKEVKSIEASAKAILTT